MRELRTVQWWYWLVAEVALAASLRGWGLGVAVAALVTIVHGAHIAIRRRRAAFLAVQIRILFLVVLAAGTSPSIHFLHWLLAIATTARLVFSYCLAGRMLSLLPWNRRERLTWAFVWRAFMSPPRRP